MIGQGIEWRGCNKKLVISSFDEDFLHLMRIFFFSFVRTHFALFPVLFVPRLFPEKTESSYRDSANALCLYSWRETLSGSVIHYTTRHRFKPSLHGTTWQNIKKINYANANVSFYSPHVNTQCKFRLWFLPCCATRTLQLQIIQLTVKYRKCSEHCVQKTYMKM